jgi:hypothetical protein
MQSQPAQILHATDQLKLLARQRLRWLTPIDLDQRLIELAAEPLQSLSDHNGEGMGGIHHPTRGLLAQLLGQGNVIAAGSYAD